MAPRKEGKKVRIGSIPKIYIDNTNNNAKPTLKDMYSDKRILGIVNNKISSTPNIAKDLRIANGSYNLGSITIVPYTSDRIEYVAYKYGVNVNNLLPSNDFASVPTGASFSFKSADLLNFQLRNKGVILLNVDVLSGYMSSPTFYLTEIPKNYKILSSPDANNWIISPKSGFSGPNILYPKYGMYSLNDSIRNELSHAINFSTLGLKGYISDSITPYLEAYSNRGQGDMSLFNGSVRRVSRMTQDVSKKLKSIGLYNDLGNANGLYSL